MRDGLIDLHNFAKNLVREELRDVKSCRYLLNCSKNKENDKLMKEIEENSKKYDSKYSNQ